MNHHILIEDPDLLGSSSIPFLPSSGDCQFGRGWNPFLARLSSHANRVRYSVGIPVCLAKFDIVDTVTMDDIEGMTLTEVLLNAITD